MPNTRTEETRHCLFCKKEFHPFEWEQTRQQFCSVKCRWNSIRAIDSETFFWSRVTKTDGCWIWTGSIMSKGYGRFKKNRRHFYAHRFSLELHLGRKLISGEQANHGCDNRQCVRVGDGHIFLGTQKDNILDAMNKGRMAVQRPEFHASKKILSGELHPRAKLNEEIIREIRRLREEGWTQQAIADVVGHDQGNISGILLGKSWAHVK